MKQTLFYGFERSVPHIGILHGQLRLWIADAAGRLLFVGAWFGYVAYTGRLRQAMKVEWRATVANLQKYEPLFEA